MILADTLYDPNANWTDVPSALRTPNQNAQMFTDVIIVGWPVFLVILGIVLLAMGSNRRKQSKLSIFGAAVCFLLAIAGFINWFI